MAVVFECPITFTPVVVEVARVSPLVRIDEATREVTIQVFVVRNGIGRSMNFAQALGISCFLSFGFVLFVMIFSDTIQAEYSNLSPVVKMARLSNDQPWMIASVWHPDFQGVVNDLMGASSIICLFVC